MITSELLALAAFLAVALPIMALALVLAARGFGARKRLAAMAHLQRDLLTPGSRWQGGAAWGSGEGEGAGMAWLRQTTGVRWALARAEDDLSKTAWTISPEVYLLRRVLVLAAAAVLGGQVAHSLVGSVVAAAAAHLLWDRLVARQIGRYRREIGRQTEQVIENLTAHLRAGQSLGQSLAALADEAPSPSREEYERVARQLALGAPISEALRSLEVRVPIEAVSLLVASLTLHNRIGGELPMLLRIAADTIRDRIRLQEELRTAASGQMLASYVVCGLPVILFFGLMLIDRPYISGLLQPDWRWLLMLGAAMETVGFVIMRSFTRVEL